MITEPTEEDGAMSLLGELEYLVVHGREFAVGEQRIPYAKQIVEWYA
ncbi:MAG TPA: hypothetical protein VGJ48_25805 [Pyrinomonadaceae bacterium]|jgi:hypothetical protein